MLPLLSARNNMGRDNRDSFVSIDEAVGTAAGRRLPVASYITSLSCEVFKLVCAVQKKKKNSSCTSSACSLWRGIPNTPVSQPGRISCRP